MDRRLSATNGTCLIFPSHGLYKEYEAKIREIEMKTYGAIRAQHGIWASYQKRFVKSPDELMELDSRVMEERYAEYVKQCNEVGAEKEAIATRTPNDQRRVDQGHNDSVTVRGAESSNGSRRPFYLRREARAAA